ncbi:MAG: DNA repair protein RecN [Rhizobiaceae bacterium]
MLSQLSIRNIVLIERLDLEFIDGLSVLTGETGAGKSILLDGLSLALGARGDGGLVRNGEEQGSITAVFELSQSHPAREFCRENDLPDEDSLILRRMQAGDGRTRAFINDTAVSAKLLRQLGKMLVEIHGQHDDRAMLEPSTHRLVIDAFGGLEQKAELVSKSWKGWRKVLHELDVFQAKIEAAQREGDYLRSSCAELEKLAPEPGEETKLDEYRRSMMGIEQITTDLSEAHDILSGRASPIPTLSSLTRRLVQKQEQVPGLLDETVEALDQALNALYSAQDSLAVARRDSEFDPAELEHVEERLFALRAASRKYSVAVENLPDLAVKMREDLADLDAGEEKVDALLAKCRELEQKYFKLAEELSKKRKIAGEQLCKRVMEEFPSLKLEAAEFIVEQNSSRDVAGSSGIDDLEFWVRTNPGTKAGPIAKVASGGELSRFLLSLKVAIFDKGTVPTLVFDEIDTGVGGAVADAIGQRLARLSSGVQVLSVTHAPQVAARADHHFLISKQSDKKAGHVTTSVEPILDDIREEEIARMLSGASISDEARAAANQLLAQNINN